MNGTEPILSQKTPKEDLGTGEETPASATIKGMKHERIGSDFDDFLKRNGLLAECEAGALKRVIAWQIERERISDSAATPAPRKLANLSQKIVDLADEPVPGIFVPISYDSMLTYNFAYVLL
jgi:antitoxin HicB